MYLLSNPVPPPDLCLPCVSRHLSLFMSNSLSRIINSPQVGVVIHTHTHNFTPPPSTPRCTFKLKNSTVSALSHIDLSTCTSIHPSIFHTCGELNIRLSIHFSSLLILHVSLSFSIFTMQSPTHPSVQPPFQGLPSCSHTHTLPQNKVKALSCLHTHPYFHRSLYHIQRKYDCIKTAVQTPTLSVLC